MKGSEMRGTEEEEIIGGRDERAESKAASQIETGRREKERDSHRGVREQWCGVRLI